MVTKHAVCISRGRVQMYSIVRKLSMYLNARDEIFEQSQTHFIAEFCKFFYIIIVLRINQATFFRLIRRHFPREIVM